MIMIRYFILVLSLLFVLGACTTEPDPYLPADDENFYPLELGKYWVYEVDSIIFRPEITVEVDSVQLWMREEIVDTILDNSGNTLFVVEQSERYNLTDPWEFKQLLTVGLLNNQIIRTENNLRFIKMVFPIQLFQQWDGNIFIDPTTIVRVGGETIEMFKDWSYSTIAEGESINIEGENYEDVITIAPSQSENLIELRKVEEQYANNIGLISRTLEILDTQIIDPALGWQDKAEKGFIVRQLLVESN
jgi:hypothetical protein